ncbi:MAG: bifunctional hydroxymethylpyrimidine kinase/phosphomethylpyrimidine kinase [Candidatus Thermoplasmatota archaeon]|nr:bifunctional hydroxymethylpyrimidine kinase/phosphomethylpyrimidine kinase [Candidatus Thermoplasmatota archaeon]
MKYDGRALTIAGSDSGGGAGIQADLKTFHAFNVYGTSAVTSVTVQSTRGVRAASDIPPSVVGQQIDAVAEDIGVDAAKTGMVSSTDIIETIAESVTRHAITRLVVDPVMVAESGDRLLQEDAETSLVDSLLPAAYLVTPNVFEAELISGIDIETLDDAKQAAAAIQSKGPRLVLLKGGHLAGATASDILYDGDNYEVFEAPRVDTTNTHGTGCTFSAAITAGLAKEMDVHDAIDAAKDYVTRALQHAPDIGHGNGPLYHNLQPLQPSAFKEAAADFDAWFDKNRTVFQSELLAEKELLPSSSDAVSIGVGTGLFASKLGIKHGVEPAEDMATRARERGIDVRQGTGEDVPYPDERFDTVLLSTVLSYADDPQQALNEAYRILKPGGHVVVSFLTGEGAYAMLYEAAYLRGSHKPAISPRHPYPLPFIRGARWLTTADVTAMLQKAGFTDLRYVQTLRRHPKYTDEQVETPVEGYKEGDFVVVRGRKP